MIYLLDIKCEMLVNNSDLLVNYVHYSVLFADFCCKFCILFFVKSILIRAKTALNISSPDLL